jgi:hypothetical protein
MRPEPMDADKIIDVVIAAFILLVLSMAYRCSP